MEFMPHMKRTDLGACPHLEPWRDFSSLTPPIKHTDKGEKTARSIEIDFDLAGKPVHQSLRAVIVNAPPAHVDRLDLAGGGAYRLVIAFADQEIILDDAAERRQRQDMGRDILRLRS